MFPAKQGSENSSDDDEEEMKKPRSASSSVAVVADEVSSKLLMESLHRRIARGTVAKGRELRKKNTSDISSNAAVFDAAMQNAAAAAQSSRGAGGGDDDKSKPAKAPKEITSPTAAAAAASGFAFTVQRRAEEEDAVAAANREEDDEERRLLRESTVTEEQKHSQPSLLKCIAWLACATAAFVFATRLRSNGILLGGFFLHFAALSLWFRAGGSRKSKQRQQQARGLSASSRLVLCVLALVATVFVLLPYHFHVQQCYSSFCAGASSAAEFDQKLLLAESLAEPVYADKTLCRRGPGGYYSGVQEKYWKVGLFQYYTMNNIPNFVIAAPTFLFCLIGFAHFCVVRNEGGDDDEVKGRRKVGVVSWLFSTAAALASVQAAHLVYLFAQLSIALAIMNVQVVTRFVAGTPALYLLYGFVLGSARASAAKTKKSWVLSLVLFPRWAYSERVKVVCVGFCLVWALVGTAMFSNFMPWT
jgi:hypothetical protein